MGLYFAVGAFVVVKACPLVRSFQASLRVGARLLEVEPTQGLIHRGEYHGSAPSLGTIFAAVPSFAAADLAFELREPVHSMAYYIPIISKISGGASKLLPSP